MKDIVNHTPINTRRRAAALPRRGVFSTKSNVSVLGR